ncbi:hypothetical protein JCM19314_1064 [Nonlabens ulvanivorans]|uniref:Uncharacterized protein n=1 Tax=Nonlabens ulvanivorans TaxID=906888 RepID=A0A090Q9W1_NONUL|nr:hypothetical protein JCM19314_1064 [Nonlabens ulvanivorans]
MELKAWSVSLVAFLGSISRLKIKKPVLNEQAFLWDTCLLNLKSVTLLVVIINTLWGI